MAESTLFSAIPSVLPSQIRDVVAQDLKRCGLSRDEVAARMTAVTGRNIKRSQLEAFIAASKPHRFPLDLVSVWVRITQSRSLLELVCGDAGLYVADDTDRKLADFGRTVIAREEMTVREARLKAALKERI